MSAELDSAMKSANTLMDMCGRLLAERDRLKAANAELAEACEAFLAYDEDADMDGLSSMFAYNDALTKARAALTKHQGATA